MSYSTCVCLGAEGLVEAGEIGVATDWVELRIDLLPQVVRGDSERIAQWLAEVARAYPHIILTYKSGDSQAHRIHLLGKLLSGGTYYLDIDHGEHAEYQSQLFDLAARTETPVIHSYHFSQWDGNLSTLRDVIQLMQSRSPWYTKIVAPCRRATDSSMLLSLYFEFTNIILIDSSRWGFRSRFLAPLLGAPFTYSYHDTPTGPHQAKAQELQHLLSSYKDLERKTLDSPS